MSRPSEVIVLVEDKRQEQIIRRYLRRIGLETHAMRFELPSSGSGEQWVREQFPREVTAYRRRNVRVETRLIVVIDADSLTHLDRLEQLDQKLREVGVGPVRAGVEQVARLIPRRNIETWIVSLNGGEVNEAIDYKKTRNDWGELIQPAAERLFAWTRPNAQLPEDCIPSLQHGVAELGRLDFRAR